MSDIYQNTSHSKVLPVSYPPITYFPDTANILSIAMNYSETIPWLMEHFIQIKCWLAIETENDYLFDFECVSNRMDICPFVKDHLVPIDMILKKWKNYAEFIVDSINNNYYIFLMVDQYFIPEYNSYNKIHAPHELFIFGYDLEKKSFNIADFFKNNKYNYTQATFEQVTLGCESSVADYQNKIGWLNDGIDGIVLLKYADFVNYKFDIWHIINFINDYLLAEDNSSKYCRNSRFKVGSNILYGVKVYDKIIERIKETYEQNLTFVDTRMFSLLYDHKTAMKMRIRFLEERNYLTNLSVLSNSYDKIYDLSLILRNLAIKFNITNDKNILLKILTNLETIKDLEITILSNLLNELKVKYSGTISRQY